MMASLEHTNLTVSDPKATAAWMKTAFGWKIRWEGGAMDDGYTVHIGTNDSYLALYSPPKPTKSQERSYDVIGGLNHLGIVVDDLAAAENRVIAAGFKPKSHYDYEPGKRFYFDDDNGIEFEVVQYD